MPFIDRSEMGQAKPMKSRWSMSNVLSPKRRLKANKADPKALPDANSQQDEAPQDSASQDPRAAANTTSKPLRNGFFGGTRPSSPGGLTVMPRPGRIGSPAPQQQQVQTPNGLQPPQQPTQRPGTPQPKLPPQNQNEQSEQWQEVYQKSLDGRLHKAAWGGRSGSRASGPQQSNASQQMPLARDLPPGASLRPSIQSPRSDVEVVSSDDTVESVGLAATRSTSSLTSEDSEENGYGFEDDGSGMRSQQPPRPPAWAVDPQVAFRNQASASSQSSPSPGPSGQQHTQPPEVVQQVQQTEGQGQEQSKGSTQRPQPPWAVESKGFRAAALGNSPYGGPMPQAPQFGQESHGMPQPGPQAMVAASPPPPEPIQMAATVGMEAQQAMSPYGWGGEEEQERRELRIVSLVGAATDIVCCLGLEDMLVARSHECVLPRSLERLPCVTSSQPANDLDAGSKGRPVSIDAGSILSVSPSIIVAQEACDLCAVSLKDLQVALRDHLMTTEGYGPLAAEANAQLYGGAQLITIRPFMMSDIWDGVKTIAEAVGRPERGQQMVEELKQRWAAVRQMVPRRRRAQRVRVACLGQLRPLSGSGYWIPEIVACAGGIHIAGKAGERTEALSMELLLQRDPDIIVIACRGMSLRHALETLITQPDLPEWDSLSAVKAGRVYAVDGSRYFNSPGPRVVDSVEVMADILQRDFLETSGAETEGGDHWGSESGRLGASLRPEERSMSFERGYSGGEDDHAVTGGPLSADKSKSMSWVRSPGVRNNRVWPVGEKANPREQLQQAVVLGSAFARLPGNSTADWLDEIADVLQATGGFTLSVPALTVPRASLPNTPYNMEQATAVAKTSLSKPEQLRQLLLHTISQSLPADGILLSGGLGSSVLAFSANAFDTNAVTLAITVLAGSKASDREPAAAAASRYGMQHVVVGGAVGRPESLLSSELRFVVRTLKTFDPAEVRAGIAMAAALREAKRRGCTCLITGDGADELFSAFEFLAGMSEDKAYQCRKHVQETMRFPVADLARAMGIQVRQPFLHPAVREFALSLTKGELQCDGHELAATWGARFAESKLLLRLAFPEVEASQRRSDAIEVGAGTYVLTKRLLKRMPKDEFEKHKQRVLWEDVVDLRDAEQLHYYQAFRDEFEGLIVPGVQRWGLNACLSCGYPPLFEGQLACTTCGEYPARRLTKLVMEGWEGKAGAEEKYSPALQQKMLNQVMPRNNLPPGLPKSPFSPSWKRSPPTQSMYDQDFTTLPDVPVHSELRPGSYGSGNSRANRRKGAGVSGSEAGQGVTGQQVGTSKSIEVGLDELFALHEVFLVFGGSDGSDSSLPTTLDHMRDGLSLWRGMWPNELSVC